MTQPLPPAELAERIGASIPGAVRRVTLDAIYLNADQIASVARFLRETPGLDLDHLEQITAIDYEEYFDVIYHLVSLAHNHDIYLRIKLWERIAPRLPTLYHVYRGADFQEREIYDLMGIVFDGHPNPRRILTWDDFVGHPLRKDYRLHTVRRSPWGPYKLEP